MFTDSTNYSRPARPKLANRDLLNGDRRENYFKYGAPLYEASIQGDWKSAKAILDKKPELVRYSLTQNGETALHVAASANRSKQIVQFVKNLVDLMEEEDLELVNIDRNTALYLAAAAGNIETVKIMMEKNSNLDTIPGGVGKMMPNLDTIPSGVGKMVPLYAAALFGNKDVVRYLYKSSKDLGDAGWNRYSRGWLLEKCAESDMYDIAFDIVKKYPALGRSSLLGVLARKPEAFLETKSSIIKGTVYSVCAFIGLKVEMPEKESQALKLLRILWEDIMKLPKKRIDAILRGPPDPIKSASRWALQAIQLKELISEQLEDMENTYKSKQEVPQLKKIVSKYVLKMHTETQNIIKEENRARSSEGNQALELENIISENIVNLHDDTQKVMNSGAGVKVLHGLISNHIRVMHGLSSLRVRETYSSRVLFIAAQMGNTNFIVELIRRYPDLIWRVNDNNLSIFHIAVKHRHAGIYNLLFEIGTMKDMITPLKDKNGNNMLHLVGKIAKQKRLANVSGVALQMQRELLWFQEVEKMIPPSYREQKNKDGLTPHDLFTKEHKELVTQGEKWMKGTANQCMVVAALIATIVFAAAFTVPGGYDQNNGIPMFYSKATFVVFVVADAISLFASSASILIFLSILTSRYAERDFLESIPKKLVTGLATLFISIASMTLAFGVIFFVLYEKGFLWIPILISVFALLPVVLYLFLQYGLFADVIRSTYRSRYLFKPKKHVLYYENPKF